uniref:Uncharacterized protein n=1 Tax=Cacopsylla melanoneura TaxID=428564 RepID=A0A8D8PVD5_9HEMI
MLGSQSEFAPTCRTNLPAYDVRVYELVKSANSKCRDIYGSELVKDFYNFGSELGFEHLQNRERIGVGKGQRERTGDLPVSYPLLLYHFPFTLKIVGYLTNQMVRVEILVQRIEFCSYQ